MTFSYPNPYRIIFSIIFKTMLTVDVLIRIKGGIVLKKSEPMSESYYYILLCYPKGRTTATALCR